MNDPLIYLHIPKTGGTTVRSIIERLYEGSALFTVYDDSPSHNSMSDLDSLSSEARKSIQIYCGHVSYGFHQPAGVKPNYTALLRHPIDRVLSFYHHTMTYDSEWKDKPVSLVKFIHSKNPQMNNHQTRIVSGMGAPFNQCPEEMLWKAIENIEKEFLFVGVSELFDESLLVLSETVGWSDPFYIKENVSKGRPVAEYFSQMEINVIKNHNQLDLLLYAYVKKKQLAQIAVKGPSLRDKLRTFRDLNKEAAKKLKTKTVWS